MRVAILTGAFPQPSQAFILSHVTGLIDAGVDVEIFASRPKTDVPIHEAFLEYDLDSRTFYRPQIPPAGVGRWSGLYEALCETSWRIRRGVLKSLFRAGDRPPFPSPLPGYFVRDLLKRGPFDIVHAQFGIYGRYAVAARELGHCESVVTTFHGFDANVIPSQKGPDVYERLFKVGDLFTVNSRFLKGRLVALGCPEDRIRMLPMGVDTEQFCRTDFVPSQGRVELVSVARLVEAKGLKYAIQAVAALLRDGHSIRYRIVGGGEDHKMLVRLIAELGVEEEVVLVGPKPHELIPCVFAESDIFILPSIRTRRGDEETQGVVVQEAQACGLPVVVTNIGGIPEGLIDGESGVVCEPENVEALRSALSSVIARRDEWPKMGAIGRRFVESNYSKGRLLEQLVEIYRESLS